MRGSKTNHKTGHGWINLPLEVTLWAAVTSGRYHQKYKLARQSGPVHTNYYFLSSMAFRPPPTPPGKGRGVAGALGSIFAGYVPLASQSPYLIIIYSVANHRAHLNHFCGNVNFAIPTSEFSHFLVSLHASTLKTLLTRSFEKGINTFVKLYVEHVLYSHICTANRLIFLIPKIPTCQNILTPQIPKICDPDANPF